jgi:hypothetical protein
MFPGVRRLNPISMFTNKILRKSVRIFWRRVDNLECLKTLAVGLAGSRNQTMAIAVYQPNRESTVIPAVF